MMQVGLARVIWAEYIAAILLLSAPSIQSAQDAEVDHEGENSCGLLRYVTDNGSGRVYRPERHALNQENSRYYRRRHTDESANKTHDDSSEQDIPAMSLSEVIAALDCLPR